jgi:hypothetical protein
LFGAIVASLTGVDHTITARRRAAIQAAGVSQNVAVGSAIVAGLGGIDNTIAAARRATVPSTRPRRTI